MQCKDATKPEPVTDPLDLLDQQRGGDETVGLARMATVGTLACMLAHEMNNLLTPVLSYAKMALEAPANESLSRRAHESAVAGAMACNAMATSLLGFVVDAQGTDPRAEVEPCIRQAIQCVPRNMSKDGVSLQTSIEPSLYANISPTALTQVLLNLILNARQAMHDGGVLEIKSECSTWNNDDPAVRITIKDSGCGIEPDRLTTIFQPFVSENKANGGTGLGLAITQRIIDSAGGHISVESEPGVGTVFTIDIPAAIELEQSRSIAA